MKDFLKNPLSYVRKYWFVGLIIFFILVGVFSDDSSSETTAALPAPSTAAKAEQVTDYKPDLTPGNSLATGTVLKKRTAYLQGEGELKISNGTSYDAVAKLISGGASVLTVYIKANSTYTMQNISDGVYWLAFAQGTDWNATEQKFNRNAHFQAFDETFDFTTSETEASAWSVTLNPVVGGNAASSDVNPDQFNQY